MSGLRKATGYAQGAIFDLGVHCRARSTEREVVAAVGMLFFDMRARVGTWWCIQRRSGGPV